MNDTPKFSTFKRELVSYFKMEVIEERSSELTSEIKENRFIQPVFDFSRLRKDCSQNNLKIQLKVKIALRTASGAKSLNLTGFLLGDQGFRPVEVKISLLLMY